MKNLNINANSVPYLKLIKPVKHIEYKYITLDNLL